MSMVTESAGLQIIKEAKSNPETVIVGVVENQAYVSAIDVANYMENAGIDTYTEALENIAEANKMSIDNLNIVIEAGTPSCVAEAVESECEML